MSAIEDQIMTGGVFISYKREDCAKAEQVEAHLRRNGCSTWRDTSLTAGEAWSDVITRELSSAKCVVVLWSERAWVSEWVQREARSGLDRRALFPARLDDVRVLPPFDAIQTADLRAPDGLEDLVIGVRRHMGITAALDWLKAADKVRRPTGFAAGGEPTRHLPPIPSDANYEFLVTHVGSLDLLDEGPVDVRYSLPPVGTPFDSKKHCPAPGSPTHGRVIRAIAPGFIAVLRKGHDDLVGRGLAVVVLDDQPERWRREYGQFF